MGTREILLKDCVSGVVCTELSIIVDGKQVFVTESPGGPARYSEESGDVTIGNLVAPGDLVASRATSGWAEFWLGLARLVIWFA